jgi:hypothetical protein
MQRVHTFRGQGCTPNMHPSTMQQNKNKHRTSNTSTIYKDKNTHYTSTLCKDKNTRHASIHPHNPQRQRAHAIHPHNLQRRKNTHDTYTQSTDGTNTHHTSTQSTKDKNTHDTSIQSTNGTTHTIHPGVANLSSDLWKRQLVGLLQEKLEEGFEGGSVHLRFREITLANVHDPLELPLRTPHPSLVM